MNRYIKTSTFYAVLGLIGGAFYREFTKFNGIDGGTALAYIHVHTIALGMIFFLILSLFEDKFHMSSFKGFKSFNILYNGGLMTIIGIFLVRGVVEVLALDVSRTFTSSLSGISGLAHISLTIGLMTMLWILNKASKKFDKKAQRI